MDQDEALAGDYVGVMLATIAAWIASLMILLTIATYLGLSRL